MNKLMILLVATICLIGCAEQDPLFQYADEIHQSYNEQWDETYASGISLEDHLSGEIVIPSAPDGYDVAWCMSGLVGQSVWDYMRWLDCDIGDRYPITDELILDCEDAAEYAPIIVCHDSVRSVMMNNPQMSYRQAFEHILFYD